MDQQTNLISEQPANQPVYVASTKNKKIGKALIIGPIVGLILTIILYAVSGFLMNSIASNETGATVTIAKSINTLVGLLGIVSVVGIIVGIPLGIIFLGKKELTGNEKYDERSGKKGDSIVPDEIKGWNWGAAGLLWIWGVYHGIWISLLSFIPYVNIIMVILLGLKGSEWAWKKRRWESVEKFTASQKKWKPWGIVFFVIMVINLILNILKLVR